MCINSIRRELETTSNTICRENFPENGISERRRRLFVATEPTTNKTKNDADSNQITWVKSPSSLPLNTFHKGHFQFSTTLYVYVNIVYNSSAVCTVSVNFPWIFTQYFVFIFHVRSTGTFWLTSLIRTQPAAVGVGWKIRFIRCTPSRITIVPIRKCQ